MVVAVLLAEPEAAGEESDDVEPAFEFEAVADSLLSAGLLALAPDLDPLLRKSVTYHPDPLSWNPAAVTCLA